MKAGGISFKQGFAALSGSERDGSVQGLGAFLDDEETVQDRDQVHFLIGRGVWMAASPDNSPGSSKHGRAVARLIEC
jgi:hypothetical protein